MAKVIHRCHYGRHHHHIMTTIIIILFSLQEHDNRAGHRVSAIVSFGLVDQCGMSFNPGHLHRGGSRVAVVRGAQGQKNALYDATVHNCNLRRQTHDFQLPCKTPTLSFFVVRVLFKDAYYFLHYSNAFYFCFTFT